MKRVFISTSWGKLQSILPKSAKNSKGIDKLRIRKEKILYYNPYSKSFQDQETSRSDIILILDQEYPNTIKNITVKRKSDYLLRHDKPLGQEYNQFDLKVHGNHMSSDNKYPPTFEIIFDDQDNKVDRILEVIGLAEKDIKRTKNLESKIQVWKEISLLDIKILRNRFSKSQEEINKLDGFKNVKDYDEFKNAKEEFWKNHIAPGFERGQSFRTED